MWRLYEDVGQICCRESSTKPVLADVKSHELALYRKLHATIAKINGDMERLHFNTAIAALMELVNALYDEREKGGATQNRAYGLSLVALARLMAPFAPHLGEEAWHLLGHSGSVFQHGWLEHDPTALVQDEVEIAVQINGKVRGRITVPAEATQLEVHTAVMQMPELAKWLSGVEIVSEKLVPGRLYSIAVK